MTKGLDAMIRDMIVLLREAGVPVDESVASKVEIKLRRQYGGERVYIQSLPKQMRAANVAEATKRLGTAAVTLKRIAQATGIPIRTVKRLRNGR